MQSQNHEGWSHAKKRLHDLLKAAVGGVVIATTTVTTTASGATINTTGQQQVLAQRVQELRQQIANTAVPGDVAENVAAWHNWGNHWSNWNNWHNWGNWHNW
jgi:hypothetical protein